jgi:hypothetical protein
MKRKRHTEEQIIAIRTRGWGEDSRSVPQARDQRGELLQRKAKYGGLGLRGQASEGAGEREHPAKADAMLDNAALKDLLAKKW